MWGGDAAPMRVDSFAATLALAMGNSVSTTRFRDFVTCVAVSRSWQQQDFVAATGAFGSWSFEWQQCPVVCDTGLEVIFWSQQLPKGMASMTAREKFSSFAPMALIAQPFRTKDRTRTTLASRFYPLDAASSRFLHVASENFFATPKFTHWPTAFLLAAGRLQRPKQN